MINVTPSEFTKVLEFMVPRQEVILVTSAPGCGKSTMCNDFGVRMGMDVQSRWPGNEDPTVPGGFPWCYSDKKGNPYANLVMYEHNRVLLEATKPTLIVLDDFGQATNAVQSAYMPLLLDRKVGGKKLSDFISFVVCTNRREDRANVSGILLPIRSRCLGGIYNLTTSTRDFKLWGLKNGLPFELIQFIGLMESRRENRLLDENPPKEITGYYCPRTVAAAGFAQKAGIPENMEYTIFAGICGESWAAEYTAFLKIARNLPSKEQIFAMPDTAPVPDYTMKDGAATLFAVCGMLSLAANEENFGSIITYSKRLPAEYQGMLLDDCVNPDTGGNPALTQNIEYIRYSSKNAKSNVGL
jgi:hypothetical protein